MAWPLIISAVGSALSGMGSAKASKKAQANDIAAQKDLARIQGQESRRSDRYAMELQDYYQQLNKQRSRNARGAMFDKYSSVAKPEGFERAQLAAPEAPGVPYTETTPAVSATYKKPSLWDRLTKPSLNPFGPGPGQPRGDMISAGTPAIETTRREPTGG